MVHGPVETSAVEQPVGHERGELERKPRNRGEKQFPRGRVTCIGAEESTRPHQQPRAEC